MAAKRWNNCNVLAAGAEALRLWQFDLRGNAFKLSRELTLRGTEALPDSVKRSWSSLWQPRLNVACLPADRVFVRAAQFPKASFEETLAMVGLQMEKLSPLPVGQIVWTMHCLDHPDGNQQTVIIVIAATESVEGFLGKLEAQGYLADRLELPALDQLLGTKIQGDGAWVYPEALGSVDSALVAWWYAGVLRSIDLLTLPATSDRVAVLREQLLHMAWAGDMEGWLTSAPKWHLVAAHGTNPIWSTALHEALGEDFEMVAPLATNELAACTVQRVATHIASASLMPPGYAERYRQQFVDRLWMRGLGALVLLYIAGLIVYFGWLGVAKFRTGRVESQVAALSLSYTNALQMRDRYNVLKDRQELKYAALDCLRLVAQVQPEGVTLEGFNFSDGQRLSLNGTASPDAVDKLIEFPNDLRKSSIEGKPVFKDTGDPLSYRSTASGVITWNFSLELRRTELN